ncbi:MAG: hypothetical protein UT54_C0067G0007 [Candidatus Daviesbacteria bacterium GW2011_GWB1_39_5]|uniref:Glycosyltransferase RgtA/B/C/D-like domain-containing protein n=1 Tax=Candidatus Daviesbacteria bacterium GW2011_GWC2_40_12 TaxID=1618431 RepID=A0A0G0QXW9_9BACT|nr:MAG: hypothetical protein UT04_C0054G0002 [Candidatus Daviesbacteria bacterium GW2011_GWF2_38_7]KKR16336.1 MAG: hypothetical protein UT45_C0006G0011 [Candidatus Daviesbacteria bacterium GW2011_GWA2_39_33]KKR22479.1 MAG: hypothetical protein UT54_C0067G0007 [Candidatus Daviesbacteria bacterium GW2011_GWB1_39_5]KKR42291.1 MAG: hypothetical protein UT77_C0003G0086 [Candidatus Daviesbacteria bacterium GW2011_GWC2_40_12]OGE22030.1 MAG: hypothetical protein A2778_01815 [Candidatus Daviesbacteria b
MHRLLNAKILLTFVILLGLFSLWTYKGITETGIHVDLARDLNEVSNLWMHKIVWLGPMTSANFPASPIYYYLLFPGLILSGGNGLSLIVSQTFFALFALGIFAFFQLKKSFVSTILVILTIGLSPWWISSSSFIWNGHMYVSWVLLALVSLWFKKPLFISALLFGVSIAINPVAAMALPVLFYEWIIEKRRLKNLMHILLGLALPWTPIILFEIITKGFLTRHWLQYPSSAGITFIPNLGNIIRLINTIYLPNTIVAIIAAILTFLMGSKRERYWLIFISLPLLFLAFTSPLRQYYTLGLICALSFIFVMIWSSKTIGKIILVIMIFLYTQTITFTPLSFAGRSIQRMDNAVNTFIQNNNLDKTKKYAVVSVRDTQNSTPQADDFRFFLRTKGINALNIDEYPQADNLILFVEVPNFKWQEWEDWHILRFGKKRFLSNQNIDGIEIVMYEKE